MQNRILKQSFLRNRQLFDKIVRDIERIATAKMLFNSAIYRRILFILALQVSFTNSCVPGIGGLGVGPLLRNPRFTFDITPASLWTYSTQTLGALQGIGQSADATSAQQALNNDIRTAILTALSTWKITNSFTVTAMFTQAPTISGPTAAGTPCGTPQGGGVGGTALGGCSIAGTMISSFTTQPPGNAYTLTLNVLVTTTTFLTQDQWILIGNQILTNLAVNAKALPRSLITSVTGDQS